MTVFDWLKSKLPTGETVVHRLAWLVNRNCGYLSVQFTPDGKVQRARGAQLAGNAIIHEMMELTGMVGCFDGFVKASDGQCWDKAKKLLDDECSRQGMEGMSVEEVVHGRVG
jgi:hypothetical protein